MKIFINRSPKQNQAWGGGNNFVSAFFQHAKDNNVELYTKLNQKFDAIFLMDPRPDELGVGIDEIIRYKSMFPNVSVFHRVNECDARKGVKDDIDPVLRKCSTITSHTFWVSNWMRAYHRTYGWGCESESIVYNGVDTDIFKPNKKLENGKINIVTHHWSNNPFKGGDVHVWLDEFVGKNSDRFTYTYIGRTNDTFTHTKIIEPLWGRALGDELGKYDVYITGTVCDPGPNHVIEALSCCLPTFAHKRGGGAVEFVGTSHIYSDANQLEAILNDNIARSTPNAALKLNDWRSSVTEYFSKMKEIVGHA